LTVVDINEFRRTMGHWVSGVAIVTATADGLRHGMTLSSLISVSIRPPLVAICANSDSLTNQIIQSSGCFGVNILARSQEQLAKLFADKAREHERFAHQPSIVAVTGAPLLPDCAATLDCKVVAAHTSGDHVIYVGEVLATECRDVEPLTYGLRQYGAFTPSG
jgi:flavin reductase (DIM6/NTAB) family NADH-FMN oxidoreductase RutF